MTQPAIFLSHGSPMVLAEPSEGRDFLKTVGGLVERPRAILSVTGHWTTTLPVISADPKPRMIYDFGGFPDELYQLDYPAPGAPDVAKAAAKLFEQADIDYELTNARGYDHGTWVPLFLGFPDADIPVAQLSVQPYQSPAWHYRLGQALRSLREDNVLIIGSGSTTHNLRALVRSPDAPTPAWVSEFAEWLQQAVAENRLDDLLDYASKAPSARKNHPTPEHFLPFFVALGAAAPDKAGELIHQSYSYAAIAMDSYRFN